MQRDFRHSRTRRKGFTLIEIVLVIAIIGIVSALTLPAMVGSIKGNRLKNASRAIISAGKYARSLAVMRQKEMILSIDIDRGQITVHSYNYFGSEKGDSAVEGFLAEAEESDKDDIDPETGEPLSKGPIEFTDAEVQRDLGKIMIEVVEIKDTFFFDQGIAKIIYYPNGQCDPYSVRMVDNSGAIMIVRVDHLSGVETEKSQ